jgi:Tol biopolymer transport system component
MIGWKVSKRLALLAFLAAALFSIPARAEPPPEADGPNILYSSFDPDCDFDCKAELWLAHLNGSEPTQLTATPHLSEFDASWSPDGKRILFYGWFGRYRSDIFSMAADGSDLKNLTDSPSTYDHSAEWSPDGTRIVFVTGRDNRTRFRPQVKTMSADGSRIRRLKGGSAPTWSPDGANIAFLKNDVNDRDLRAVAVMTSRGDRARVVGYGWSPAWSPDARFLAFAKHDFKKVELTQVRVARVPGGTSSLLANVEEVAEFLEWSPEGDSIGVLRDDGNHSQFLTIGVGGQVDETSYEPSMFRWSPSGNHIVFNECIADCSLDLFVAEPDGEPKEGIWDDAQASVPFSIDWQPACTVEGTNESEVLNGTPGRDLICGLGGNDEIHAGAGDDTVYAGAGEDEVQASTGADTAYGGLGDDVVRGGGGHDLLADLGGADRLEGGLGKDLLGTRDGTGNDIADGGDGTDRCRWDDRDRRRRCP